jgi:hypothetical protein
MRPAESLYQHAAEALVETLTAKDLLRLRVPKQAAIEKIIAVLLDNFRQEDALEHDAERIADEHLRTNQGLDRYKVIQLIKRRLAEERKFAL